MKVLKKIKEEKGSITMTTVAVLLFMTAAVAIASFSLSNQSIDQNKKIKQTSNSYKVIDAELTHEYKEVQDELDRITNMTYSKARSLESYMTCKKTNTIVTDEEGKEFVVPGGYKVTADADKIANGMVIQDGVGNEWVWVPVSDTDLASMYSEDNIGWTMSGTSGKNAVITNYKSTGTQYRVDPGIETVCREPDVATHPVYGDAKDLANITAAGLGNNLIEMAINLRDEYKNTIDSIKEYKGFYIGRYELSESGVQKNKSPLTNKTWYELYKKCTDLGNERARSLMIWGWQWDQVCEFISKAKDEEGNTIDINDSRKYGNYNNSLLSNNTNSGSKQNTGSNEKWKTSNIYDLAGNCWEWDQEAYGSVSRACRGGYYGNSGTTYSVLCRDGANPPYSYDHISSRPTMYIK